MRDLIFCLLAAIRLILPTRRPHRAPVPAPVGKPLPPSAWSEDFPHVTASSWARYYGDRPHLFDSHGLAAVRPYFVAYERRVEHLRQRERRTAAALASVGIDHDVALAVAVAA